MERRDSVKVLGAVAVVVAFVVGVFWAFATITSARESGRQITDTAITALSPGDILITNDETYIVTAVDGETVTVRAVSSWGKTRTLARELAALNPIVVSTKDPGYCRTVAYILSR